MSYSVCAYLTEADKVKSVYGACDNLLLNQLKTELKQELDSLNDYFSDRLNTDMDAYAALADIVNGKIRYPVIFPISSAYPFQIWRARGWNTPRCKRVTVSVITITSRKWTT